MLERPLSEQQLRSQLKLFKDKKFFSDFYKKNLLLTKRKLAASVQNDVLIIQTINNIEEIDRAANLLVKRLREWYELYNPEFSQRTPDHEVFLETIKKKSKQELLKQLQLKVEETMGAELKQRDIHPITVLADLVTTLYETRKKQESYLDVVLQDTCPNVKAIAGFLIAAKLIALAGSLKELMLMPSSTVQILGAEKALFRHLRFKAKSPKYGVLFQHPLMQKVPTKKQGRLARMLADKIAIAAKIDFFNGKFMGDKLLKQVEDKLK